MRHRGAVAAPDVDVRRPLRTIYGLFRQKWWAIGFGVAAAAWLLQVIALKLAPLSLVQTALASSFVFLGVFAERAFGMPLGRRQWLGIGFAAAGLALLGVTAAHATPSGAQSGYGVTVAVGFEAALVAAGLAFILWPRIAPSAENEPSALLLAAAAGLLFTVSHIGIKAIAGSFSVGSLAWLPLIVGAFVGAFFGSARSLQIGDAVPVIAVTSAVSNASAIVGGILVFDDPIGGAAFVVAIRMAAFALVVLAAALIPAPLRAAEPSEQLERAPETAAA
jgi:drug/metabolite transporter (DMT)-like permease